MQSLPSEKRSKIIQDYARSLLSNMDKITEANKLDFDLAQKSSTIYSPILDFLFFVQHKLLNKIWP
jgi:gamma-glutamyl phosphate reductase